MQCKKCIREQCAHWMTDFRQYDGAIEPKKVEGCVFHMIYQELVNNNRRLAMVQREMGETKNANVFQAMAILTDNAGAKAELGKIVANHFKADRLLGS